MNTSDISVERMTVAGWPVGAQWTSPGTMLLIRVEADPLVNAKVESVRLAALLDPKAYGTVPERRCFTIRSAMPCHAVSLARTAKTGDDRPRALLAAEDEELRFVHAVTKELVARLARAGLVLTSRSTSAPALGAPPTTQASAAPDSALG